jgi:hypothetical protein
LNLTYPKHQPNFGSALFIELLRSDNGSNFYVQIFYENNGLMANNSNFNRTPLQISCKLLTFKFKS